MLRRKDYHKRKPTWKSRLNADQNEAGMQFDLRYKDWTLEDWISVIWSDKASVILGYRRGVNQAWRTPTNQHISNVSDEDRTNTVNSFSRAVSIIIKNDLAISRSRRPNGRKKKLKKHLMGGMVPTSIDFTQNGK